MTKKGIETKQPASWNETKEKQMLTAFEAATTKYGGDGKSLKGPAWKEVLKDYNKASGDSLKADQLQSKLGEFKGRYTVLKSLVDLSGAEFNDVTGSITMTDANWDDAISKNPKAKWHRTKNFPLWLRCNQLFKASTATGEFAKPMKARENTEIANRNTDDDEDTDEDTEVLDAKIHDNPDKLIGAKTKAPPPTKAPPIKRSRVDDNTAAILKGLKELAEAELVSEKDPTEISFQKAINEFKRVKSLESTPLISLKETVAMKELLASSHMLFNALDDDAEKVEWIGEKLGWD